MTQVHFKKLLLGLGLLIALVYAGSMNGSFHFDDSHSIEGNIAIRSLRNIPSFWSDPRTSSFIPENRVYRPLVYTFYSFCWWIGGGKTWPFHAMKLSMHWMVTFFLFLIWQRLWSEPGWFPALSSAQAKEKCLTVRFPFLKKDHTITPTWAAFLLAILFAIHPAASECVDYISATTSLQSAMFYVWAFYSYLQFRDSGDRRKLALSLFLYFFSVASKEEGITLPAMILITEIFLATGAFETLSKSLSKTVLKNALKMALPYAIFGTVLGAWIYWMRPESGNESRGYATSWEYFMTQWRAYLFYMRIWFWPWGLNADNATIEFSKSISDPLAIQALIGNLLILAIAWFNRKRVPALLFGVLWFYVTISPASSVVTLAEAINEHRMYLSYIGFVGGTFTLLLTSAAFLFPDENREKKLGWLYAAIVIGLVIGTQERNRVWANDENLWLDTVEKNPTSGRAFNNLALVYMARGEYEKANHYFEKCEQVWPTYSYCPLNRGIDFQSLAEAAERAGKREEAASKYAQAGKSFRRAYELNPGNVHVNYHLAQYSEHIRDYAKAAELYRAAIDLTGGRYPAADLKLGSCLIKLGKFNDAQFAFKRALSVESKNDDLLFEIGKTELENGDLADAATSYRTLLERNPAHLQAWYNYGVAQVGLRRFEEARKAFEKTVALDPVSEQGWYNLAFVAERSGDQRTAIRAVNEMLKISPKRVDYQARLERLQRSARFN
ncbi:MAG: tetratricopeptide repeat protein [Oligoflexia bacterium]|nr:tetratricopeptide repeat protein [Oligoflexia bacterium]